MVKIDFRFIDFEHELHLLERYVAMLELHLPSIVESERQHLHSLYADSPPEERAGLDFVEHDLDQGIPTRAFAASAVMGLWALYEISILSVAKTIQRARGSKLGIDDLRGDFLRRAANYFDEILQFKLHIDEASATRLRHLSDVRNAFAHTGGRIRHVHESKLKRLRAAIASTPGLSNDSEYLLIDVPAARYFYQATERTLMDLFERTRAEF